MTSRLALVALLATTAPSCGGAPAASGTVGTPQRAQWQADAVAAGARDLPMATPFVIAGEQLVWRVSLRGVVVGQYELHAGEEQTIGGKKSMTLRQVVRTAGAGALVARVENETQTRIDLTSGRPVSHYTEIRHGDDAGWIEARIAAGGFDVVQKKGGAETREHQRTPAGHHVFDLGSMLLALRTWQPGDAKAATASVLRETRVWRTSLQVGAYEKATTPLGAFQAIRFDGVSRRMTRDFALDPGSPERHYSLWVTDDARRLPVLLVAKTDYGDVRMELTEYRAAAR